VSPLLTEELLEKLMLAKTKHKNLWKFYIKKKTQITLPLKKKTSGINKI
jgi:hypothetical protein